MVVFCSVGPCGMDAVVPIVMEDDSTQEEIEREAYYVAVDRAESYGYYPRGEYDEGDIDPEDEEYYVESIEGSAEDYNPRKHDGQRAGGGSFEDDFARYE